MPTATPAAPPSRLGASQSRAGEKHARPIVKWVGGKGKLLSDLRRLLPADLERRRYVEPFAGGAALFFELRPARAVLADVNIELVETYRAVRDEVDDVVRALRVLERSHRERPEDTYYTTREFFNRVADQMHDPLRAARFIYLNRTCFNGVYRVNRAGAFNVPMGRYAKPLICDGENLRAASAALDRVQLEDRSFLETAVEHFARNDFVYLDPPYDPVSATANFTSYLAGGFTREHQLTLAEKFIHLSNRGCKLMLSNSDTPFIRKLYKGFTITKISAPRAINSNASKRGLVPELVIRNYR